MAWVRLATLPFVQQEGGILAQGLTQSPSNVITVCTDVIEQMVIKVLQPGDGTACQPVADEPFDWTNAGKTSGHAGLMQGIVVHGNTPRSQRMIFLCVFIPLRVIR
jgi:hypothetical protein